MPATETDLAEALYAAVRHLNERIRACHKAELRVSLRGMERQDIGDAIPCTTFSARVYRLISPKEQ